MFFVLFSLLSFFFLFWSSTEYTRPFDPPPPLLGIDSRLPRQLLRHSRFNRIFKSLPLRHSACFTKECFSTPTKTFPNCFTVFMDGCNGASHACLCNCQRRHRLETLLINLVQFLSDSTIACSLSSTFRKSNISEKGG